MPELEILNTLLNGGIALVFLYLFWNERIHSKAARDETLKILKEQTEARILDYRFWLEMQQDIITYTGARKMIPPPAAPSAPSVNAPKDKKP